MTLAMWALLLLAAGLVLLVLEFFIPSGGSLAVMCALTFLGAIVVGFMAGPLTGATILVLEAIIVPAAVGAAVKWWPETPIGRLMLIQRPKSPDDVLPQTEAYFGLKKLIGKRGVAKGTMLPSGSVQIDGKTYDAVAEGTAIEAGQAILVVSVSTQRLVVRPDITIRAELVETSAPPNSNDPLAQEVPDPFADEA